MLRNEIEKKLVEKAWEDEDFKKQLLDDPKAVLDKAGVKFPENVTVEVLEETANKAYVVLPVNPNELSDDQLDGAAGGWFICGSLSLDLF